MGRVLPGGPLHCQIFQTSYYYCTVVHNYSILLMIYMYENRQKWFNRENVSWRALTYIFQTLYYFWFYMAVQKRPKLQFSNFFRLWPGFIIKTTNKKIMTTHCRKYICKLQWYFKYMNEHICSWLQVRTILLAVTHL